MKTFTTPAGKDITLFREPKTNHFKIKFVQGGELPEELAGMYTNEAMAEKDINVYLSNIKERKPKTKEQ